MHRAQRILGHLSTSSPSSASAVLPRAVHSHSTPALSILLSDEVKKALKEHKPIVALESTIIS